MGRSTVADPWLVPVTNLRRSVGAAREERRCGRVGELRVADSTVGPDSEATATAVLRSVDGGIEVTAVVEAPWKGECRRCLEPLDGQLRSEVRELYRPRSPSVEGDDEDGDTYPLRGEQLDLRPLVRDALLLELPLAPLCRPDCRGLCPRCGADLNQDPCSCERETVDPRWAALGALAPQPDDPAQGGDDTAGGGTA
jgi:uncharacterized protein